MNAVIKLHELVSEAIVDHSLINNKLECGGFLYGCSKRTIDGIEIIVTDAYYERKFGTDKRFVFDLSYCMHAKNYMLDQRGLGRNIKLVGCYHSHGIYPALFSPQDRILQQHWAGNQMTLIYSPKYNEMIGDIIMRDGNVLEARVTTFNDYIYDFNHIANIAAPDFYCTDKALVYHDGDRPLTLKYIPKKR